MFGEEGSLLALGSGRGQRAGKKIRFLPPPKLPSRRRQPAPLRREVLLRGRSRGMLALFAAAASRSVAAPGRSALVLFDQPESAPPDNPAPPELAVNSTIPGNGTTPAPVAGVAAGQQDSPGTEILPDGREEAQRAAEDAQRKAEEAMKDLNDAVLREEVKVNGLPATSSPVLSDSEEAQRELEQAQAEREAEQNALAEKEKARLEAEEKIRLEAEDKAKAERDALLPASPVLSASEEAQRELEHAQMEAQKATQKEAARVEEQRAADMKEREAADDAAREAAAAGISASPLGPQEADTQELEASSGNVQGHGADTQEQEADTQGTEEGEVVEWARELFYNAEPSNDLGKAGLLVHCFDESEEPPGLFKPCTTGWCATQHFDVWWSASIINSKQPNTFGDSGLLLAPSKNMVNCSFVDDVGTMRTGCHTGNASRYRNGIGKFNRGELKQMMERSMNPELVLGYNEVLLDSSKFMQRLPRSIAGVIFGLKGMDTFGEVQATQVFVSILDEYGLTEETSHIRLIKVSYDRFERMYNTSNVNWKFTDVSKGAREFLKTHPYEKHRREWLKQHPTIERHPEMAREYLARQNRRATAPRGSPAAETHIDGSP